MIVHLVLDPQRKEGPDPALLFFAQDA